MQDEARRASAPAMSGEQIVIESGSTSVTVVEVGAGLATMTVGDRDVVDGFGPDEMVPSARGQVLLPWPNRIAGGQYRWDGELAQLPVNEVDLNTAIHGLVRFTAWRIGDRGPDRVELNHRLWPSPGYPHTVDLAIGYVVGPGQVTVTTSARNAGASTAPFGAGQHPYLLPPGGISLDDCTLRVPARHYMETDRRGLPVAEHAVGGAELDFRDPRRLGDARLDTAFTGLDRDGSGRAVVVLEGHAGATSVWLGPGYTWVQVFTGDTVPAPRTRRAVAVEPMTCPPNAFVTGRDVIRLEPGATWSATWGIAVEPA